MDLEFLGPVFLNLKRACNPTNFDFSARFPTFHGVLTSEATGVESEFAAESMSVQSHSEPANDLSRAAWTLLVSALSSLNHPGDLSSTCIIYFKCLPFKAASYRETFHCDAISVPLLADHPPRYTLAKSALYLRVQYSLPIFLSCSLWMAWYITLPRNFRSLGVKVAASAFRRRSIRCREINSGSDSYWRDRLTR